MFPDLVRRVCRRLAKHLPCRVILRDEASEDVYLERYYLCGRRPAYFPEWFETRLAFLPTVFLHHFVRGDDDQELHNHPWGTSVALILAGGYVEERRVSLPPEEYFVQRRVCRPGTVNVIRGNDFHRVELLDEDCWTLFVTGKKTQTWGFWDRYTGDFTQWKFHLARRTERRKQEQVYA